MKQIDHRHAKNGAASSAEAHTVAIDAQGVYAMTAMLNVVPGTGPSIGHGWQVYSWVSWNLEQNGMLRNQQRVMQAASELLAGPVANTWKFFEAQAVTA